MTFHSCRRKDGFIRSAAWIVAHTAPTPRFCTQMEKEGRFCHVQGEWMHRAPVRWPHSVLPTESSPEDMCSLIFREELGGGERKRKKERNIDGLPPVCTLTGDRTYNLGMCPDRESNPQHFGLWDNIPTNWPSPATAHLLLYPFRNFWVTPSVTSCSYLSGYSHTPESCRFTCCFLQLARQAHFWKLHLLPCCGLVDMTLLSCHAMTLLQVDKQYKE